MDEIPVRTLNQDTAGVLARVKNGEELLITDRGRVIAHLVPVQRGPLADLIESGRLHPAVDTSPMTRPVGPIRTDNEAGELLREMRDDERW